MAVVSLVIVYIYYNATVLLERQIRDAIELELQGIVEQSADGGIARLIAVLEQRFFISGNFVYLLVDIRNQPIVWNVSGLSYIRPYADQWVEIGYRGEREGIHTGLARLVPLDDGFTLLIGQDIEHWRRFDEVIKSALLWAVALTIVTGVLGGVLMSRRILARIDAISVTSQSIMNGDLSERVAETGSGDELDRLARNLNAMLDRIEQLMRGLKDVSDNIAHDLKTPLTRLRTRVEAALRERDDDVERVRGVLEQTILDADGLIRTFDALLLIAQVEAGGVRQTFVDLNVSDVVRDVAELYAPVAEDMRILLRVHAPEVVMLRGNRELISQSLVNLIENTLKYGLSPTAREVTLGVTLDDAMIRLSVCDRGDGIPDRELSRVTGRFVRLEKSRSMQGSGLGLSLVMAVARLHGGDLELKSNEPGVCATLMIPINTGE